MKTLTQLVLIFAFAYLGMVLSRILPGKLPASILGMVLLIGVLRLRLLPERLLAEAGDFLCNNMAIFFLPPSVDILESYPLVQSYLLQVLLICLLTTVLTFFAAYGAARAVQKLLETGSR